MIACVYYKSLSDSNWCEKDYNWECFELQIGPIIIFFTL